RLINRSKATVRPGRRDDRSLGPATKVHVVVDAMLTSTMSAGSLTPRYTVGQDALKLRFEGRSLPTGPRESSAGRSSNPGPKEPRDHGWPRAPLRSRYRRRSRSLRPPARTSPTPRPWRAAAVEC